jgi:hypothetical protein
MAGTYFERFCEILDNSTILKKSTAIGVMVDLKGCITEIKSEVLLELQNKGESKNDYLDYLINEIEKQDYVKNADISYIQKYLEEYNITISEIMDMNFMKNLIVTKIDRHYNDMIPFSPEKDEAYIIQTDFLHYFCKYYADELISFLKLKKSNIPNNNVEQTIISTPMQTINKPFKDEYLKVFCEEISNERQVKETCFDLLYESIIHYVPYLETEIKENILMLDANKKDDYLEYAIDVISKTPFAKKDCCNIDKWLNKFNVDIQEFPKFSNAELNEWLGKYYNSRIPYDLKERDFILDIQIDFYCYASMIEANKMIDFLESKKSNSLRSTMDIKTEDIKKIKWIGKPSQLGYIIGKLAELGYIEAPLKPNGDTNYNQFAKLVNNTFEVETTEGTLSKYLNLDSEKGQETVRKFDDYGFNIPHIKEVS